MDIPEISLTNFQQMTSEQIKASQSFNLVSGEYLATVIIPQTGFIREQANESAILSNSIGGKAPETTSPYTCPDCGKVCKNQIGLTGHKRSHGTIRV